MIDLGLFSPAPHFLYFTHPGRRPISSSGKLQTYYRVYVVMLTELLAINRTFTVFNKGYINGTLSKLL